MHEYLKWKGLRKRRKAFPDFLAKLVSDEVMNFIKLLNHRRCNLFLRIEHIDKTEVLQR